MADPWHVVRFLEGFGDVEPWRITEPRRSESSEFGGYRVDREGELALFALEGKHELELMHADGCLKARSRGEPWRDVLPFPGRFDPATWQNVLEAMHTVAGSLERRAP